jgi:CheY-like chemotaxis protein
MARILIIEDSAHQRTALKNLLIRQGHEPILAEDGAGGLKLIADVDLVLCDVFMPVLDGFSCRCWMGSSSSKPSSTWTSLPRR